MYWRYPQIHKELKQSLYSPGDVVSVPGGWGYSIWRQSAHESCEVVSLTSRPPLPQPKEILLVLISVRGILDTRAILRPEELCQWKFPMTQSGIETRNSLASSPVPIMPSRAPPKVSSVSKMQSLLMFQGVEYIFTTICGYFSRNFKPFLPDLCLLLLPK